MYQELDQWLDELKAIRHDIHAHPEVGFDVERTAGIVADYLSKGTLC